jgi:hypothetical protein
MRWFARSAVALTLLSGCGWDLPPVEWQAPLPVASRPDTAARFAARWAPGASPEVVVDAPPAPGAPAPPPIIPAAGECPASRATAPQVRGVRWSAWWTIRPDSSAVLRAVAHDTAGAMRAEIVVDSVDVATLGCARPAPAIAADSINGYVHLAYYMVGPEGPGVFYAHLMPQLPTQFERPLAMVYGEKPVRVAVASRGDTVAVAYEDPNSELGRIAMSMSFTGGHLFDQTARIIPVSTSSQQASAPQIVRLSGAQVWVGWTEASYSGSAFLVRRAQIVPR